jgi:hypothetical protein
MRWISRLAAAQNVLASDSRPYAAHYPTGALFGHQSTTMVTSAEKACWLLTLLLMHGAMGFARAGADRTGA